MSTIFQTIPDLKEAVTAVIKCGRVSESLELCQPDRNVAAATESSFGEHLHISPPVFIIQTLNVGDVHSTDLA